MTMSCGQAHVRRGWRSRSALRGSLAFLLLLSAIVSPAALAAWSDEVLSVQNNGVDSGSCGAQSSPCRSISQAVRNAPIGAFVRVGPGRYGDLNNNGLYDAGDEGPRTSGRQGLLQLDKSVRVYSTHGAELTTIDFGPNAPSPRAVVAITTSGVYFGNVGQGFTLVGEDTAGIRMESTPIRRNIRIVGNIVNGFHGVGLYVYTQGDAITISDNVFARNSSYGLHLNLRRPSGSTGTFLIERNTIRGNQLGFLLNAANVRFTSNVIDGNRLRGGEVSAGSAIAMERNFFIGNGGLGLTVGARASDTAPAVIDTFVYNTVVGNAETGVSVAGRPITRFQRNNIYGNGVGGPSGPPIRANCGLSATGGYPGGNMYAPNNFWGSPSGPGADPADWAGSGACNGNGSPVFQPFATAPFAVDVTTDD